MPCPAPAAGCRKTTQAIYAFCLTKRKGATELEELRFLLTIFGYPLSQQHHTHHNHTVTPPPWTYHSPSLALQPKLDFLCHNVYSSLYK